MKPRCSTEGFEVCVFVHVTLFNFQSQFKQQTYAWITLGNGDKDKMWNYEPRKDDAEIT